MILAPCPGVRAVVRTVMYAVTGSSSRHLLEATALLGPKRGHSGYAAYTDWRIEWSYVPISLPGGFVAASPEVEMNVICTLPRWRPPRSAPTSLVEAWTTYIAAIEVHERGHITVATEAACAARWALSSIASATSIEDLDAAVEARMREVLDASHRRERDYDEETQHGVRQGARLACAAP